MDSAAIAAIAGYHNDVERSLRFYFSESSPDFSTRFVGLRPDEALSARDKLLAARLEETDRRSAFFILTSVEAAFRDDYEVRCKRKMKDELSRVFRNVWKHRGKRVRLNDDIFEAWKKYRPELRQHVGELRGAFKFRHLLAHGRHVEPGGKYDFNFVYALADDVLNALSLRTFD